MSTTVRLRRGTTAQHSTFTGAEGEVTVNTDKDSLVVHDGSTPGGFEHVNLNSNQRLTNKDIIAVGLSVSGVSTFSSNLNVTGILTCGILTCNSLRIETKLYDGFDTFGSSGQILSSDGSLTKWINASDANVGSATSVGINLDAVDAPRYVAFADTTTGNSVVRVDSDLSYNPSTNELSVGVVTATTFYGNGTIPVGGIIMWSGTIVNIPIGWSLCDGSNGTPDLRNRFIAGAGSDTLSVWGFNATTGSTTFTGGQSYVGVNSTGGSIAHKMTTDEMPSHTHNYTRTSAPSGGQDQAGSGSGDAVNQSTVATSSAGSNNYHENRPSYYALAFIMRTS